MFGSYAAADIKSIRAISLDYACLVTPAAIAESTLRLVSKLIRGEPEPQRGLLIRYKAHLESLIGRHVFGELLPGSREAVAAHNKKIQDGIADFKKSLSKEEFDILRRVIRSEEARRLNVNVSDIIIRYQSNLIHLLKADSAAYAETIVFVGSVQQGAYSDEEMAYSEDLLYSGKARQSIAMIAREIGASFNPLGLDEVFPLDDRIKAVLDEDFVCILYAQTHQIASTYRGDKIEFQFYSARVREIFGYPEGGLLGAFSVYPELFPKGFAVKLRQFDESMRNADINMLVGSQMVLEGEGAIDEDFRETVIEFIETAPMPESTKIPGARKFAIGSVADRELGPQELRRIVHSKGLRDLIRAGKIGLLQESILLLFSSYLKSVDFGTAFLSQEEYRVFTTLFQLISHPILNNDDKAKELIKRCRGSQGVRVICSEIYRFISTPSASRGAAGGAGGSSAFVFAGAASGPVRQSMEAVRVMAVLTHLVPYIKSGMSEQPVIKIFTIGTSDKPAASKLEKIDKILAKKGLPETHPYIELKELVTGPLPGVETQPLAAVRSPAASVASAVEPSASAAPAAEP